jgi:hypothetical protein
MVSEVERIDCVSSEGWSGGYRVTSCDEAAILAVRQGT